ncbi:MAG: hypothetical protein ACREVJ_02680 [Gammaproteobacteria bacterium]
MKHLTMMFFSSLAITALTACQETPQETAQDVGGAAQEAQEESGEKRQEAVKDIPEEEANVAEEEAQAGESMESRVEARAEAANVRAEEQYKVAVTEAEGRHKVAKEKCDAISGDDQKDACQEQADAALEREKASAMAARDAVRTQ